VDAKTEHSRLEDKLEGILSRWTRLEEQHARALADLQHSAGRIQQFERRLHQRDGTLPPDEFIQSADTGETSPAMKVILEAFQRIEARLSDIHAATMNVGRIAAAVPASPGPVAAVAAAPDVRPEPELPLAVEDESARPPGHMFRPDLFTMPPRTGASSAPPDDADPSTEESRQSTRHLLSAWIVALTLIAAAAAVVYSLQLRGRTLTAEARVRSAEQQLREAREEARRELAAVRVASERDSTAARESAAKANAIADVLAAPDLIRFDLTGTSMAPRARGQALWSRSRGLVFTASRLPSPPEGSTYQLWLITSGAPMALGSVAPDSMGRVTLAVDEVQSAVSRVVGFTLTSETEPQPTLPSGAVYLTKVARAAFGPPDSLETESSRSA